MSKVLIKPHVTLKKDERLELPENRWSGSIVCHTSGSISLLFVDYSSYPIDVVSGDVIEFEGLPLKSIICVSEEITITLMASATCVQTPVIKLYRTPVGLDEVVSAISAVRDDVKNVKDSVESTKAYVEQHFANYYQVLNIDLSRARDNEMISNNVISFYVIDLSPDAEFQIRLFYIGNDALDQTILVRGSGIENLDRAPVFLSNPAQENKYLKLLIFRRELR